MQNNIIYKNVRLYCETRKEYRNTDIFYRAFWKHCIWSYMYVNVGQRLSILRSLLYTKFSINQDWPSLDKYLSTTCNWHTHRLERNNILRINIAYNHEDPQKHRILQENYKITILVDHNKKVNVSSSTSNIIISERLFCKICGGANFFK